MTPDEVTEAVKNLTPDAEVSQAVSFILLVSKNNPAKQWEAISVRTDVQEALAVIHGWIADVREKADEALDSSPVPVSVLSRQEIKKPLDTALDNLTEDVALDNHESWQEKKDYESVAAQIQLRMGWVIDWLHKLMMWLTGSEKNWKVWVSRRAPNSCQVCISMHGVVVAMHESFEPHLLARGGKPYGGSFVAHAHPRCQCKVFYLSSEEAAVGMVPQWGDVLQ